MDELLNFTLFPLQIPRKNYLVNNGDKINTQNVYLPQIN